jgi:hypothetical protein
VAQSRLGTRGTTTCTEAENITPAAGYFAILCKHSETEQLAMTSVILFFNAASGRLLRFVLGVAVILYGLFVLGGTSGAIVAAVGLVPIALSIWGHCLFEVFTPRTPRIAAGK